LEANLIDFPGEPTTHTANLTTTKIVWLWNSVISTEDARFVTADSNAEEYIEQNNARRKQKRDVQLTPSWHPSQQIVENWHSLAKWHIIGNCKSKLIYNYFQRYFIKLMLYFSNYDRVLVSNQVMND